MALKLGAAVGIGLGAHKLIEGVCQVGAVGSGLSVHSSQTSVSLSMLFGFRIALK